jgi:flavin reductase (DIM6/NTAB) family NADH-FMN oxidoreductase RutF
VLDGDLPRAKMKLVQAWIEIHREEFYGELKKAPLIAECPVSIACTVYTEVKLPFDTLYIGEPKEVFTEENFLTENKLDIKKISPFTLTMPDNNYWSVGSLVGKAWNIGKGLKK